MAKKDDESTAVVKASSMISQENLTDKFRYVNSRIPVLDKTSLEMKIDTDEQLTIAENNASEVLSLRKEVDNIRKILKAPYFETSKAIDSYCKTIDNSLERIKVRITTMITEFKIVKEASAKIERDNKIKELEELEKNKREESDKILRIEKQLIARIYGGTFYKKDGTPISSSGCINSKDCDELSKWIDANAPILESFQYFRNIYEDIFLSVKKRLAEHKANLIDLERGEPIAREGAVRRISESRVSAEQENLYNTGLLDKTIKKEIHKEIKEAENSVDEAGKGVRALLKFDIYDESLVPRDFLSVSNTKVTEYLNANKDKIKESLIRNEEIIPGIRFFVDNSFIAR